MNFHYFVSSIMIFLLTRCGGIELTCNHATAESLFSQHYFLDKESLPKSILVKENEYLGGKGDSNGQYINLYESPIDLSVAPNKEIYWLGTKSDFDIKLARESSLMQKERYSPGLISLNLLPSRDARGVLFDINDLKLRPGKYSITYDIFYQGRSRKLTLSLYYKQTETQCCPPFLSFSGVSDATKELYCNKRSFLEKITTNIPGIVPQSMGGKPITYDCNIKNSDQFSFKSDKPLVLDAFQKIPSNLEIPERYFLLQKWVDDRLNYFEKGRWNTENVRAYNRISSSTFLNLLPREGGDSAVGWRTSLKVPKDKIIEIPYLEDGRIGFTKILVRYKSRRDIVPLTKKLEGIRPGVFDRKGQQLFGDQYMNCSSHF